MACKESSYSRDDKDSLHPHAAAQMLTSDNKMMTDNLQTMKEKQFQVSFDLTETDYEPIEKIGTGAYGVVCSATHKISKDRVAIKKIPNIFDNEHLAKRTYREIKILKHFKHDNIISIREIIKPKEPVARFKDIYIVLDLMESDLHNIIHSTQELTEEHIRYFLYQILRGLKYIHSANIIHRDLKPGNLLINENCELKIGDFGMARTVSSSEDEHKFFMTQYVATRWYRAPEIMLSLVEYTTAVDMWSVGCIFAEMFGRKPLFPGKDWINQLKLIVGIIGAPSKDVLRMSQSDMVRNFIKNLGKKSPVKLSHLYPKASGEGIDLLEKMLDLHPQKRLTVQEALKHPFLAKYHDPDDEPICIPMLAFDFEKQMANMNMKDAIMKEIMDFHKVEALPLFTGFNLRSVLKSTQPKENFTPCKDDFETGIDVFLKKVQQKPQVESGTQPVTHNQSKILPMLSSLSSTQSFCTSSQPVILECKNIQKQRQFGRVVEETERLSQNTLGNDCILHSVTENLRISSEKLSVTIDTSRNQLTFPGADVDMPSAKKSEGGINSLIVSGESVEMLSARSESKKPDHNGSPSSVTAADDSNSVPADHPVDTKALIKQVILNAEFRRQRKDSKNETSKPKPVTAIQRQREREQKRKKKIEKHMERLKKEKEKKKMENREPSLMLSDEDRQMLERWKTMQETTKPFVHPIRHHLKEILELKKETAVSTKKCEHKLDSIVKEKSECLSDQINNTSSSFLHSDIIVQHSSSQQIVHPPQKTFSSGKLAQFPDPSGKSYSSSDRLLQTKDLNETQILQTQNYDKNLDHLNCISHSRRLLQSSPTLKLRSESCGTMNFDVHPSQNNIVSYLSAKPADQSKMHSKGCALNIHSAQYDVPVSLNDSNKNLLTASTHSSGCMSDINNQNHSSIVQTVWPDIPENIYIPKYQNTQSSGHLPTFSEMMPSKTANDTKNDTLNRLNKTSVADQSFETCINNPSSILCADRQLGGMEAGLHQPKLGLLKPVQVSQDMFINMGTSFPLTEEILPDPVAVVTKQLSRSQVVDILPPVLAATPKGTGGGYGVGLDVDTLMQEMEDENKSDTKVDSAPLSASLIADWLEVSGCVDTKDLEALQQELALGSPMVFPNVQ